MFSLIHEIGRINSTYTVNYLIFYILLRIPHFLYETLPIACIIGCLIGLGNLSSKAELIILRSAGISSKSIAWYVIRPIILLMIINFFQGEYIVPVTESAAFNIKSANKETTYASKKGLWYRDGREFIYIERVISNDSLARVIRYKFDENHKMLSSSSARKAKFILGSWFLMDIKKTLFLKSSSKSISIPSEKWNISLDPKLIESLIVNPKSLSIKSLESYISYLEKQGVSSSLYQLEFWKKIFHPLANISLTLIAISFVFGPLRMASIGYRIFGGVIIALVSKIIQDSLSPFSILLNIPAFVIQIVPLIFYSFFGIYLLGRIR